MTFLNAWLLWFLAPLLLLFVQRSKKVEDTLHLIVLVFLLLAIARPVYETASKDQPVESREIIIALDVSFSMNAKDIKPSRYGFAKETIRSLLSKHQNDTVTLLAFTTNPLLLSPPTTDHALILNALEGLQREYILTHGTSLTRVFEKVVSLKAVGKNLILMTDGGEEEDIKRLLDLLERSGTALSVVALGTTRGTTIVQKDSTLLKDIEGNLVVSRINPMLKTLASASSGTYITATSPETTAEEISNAIQSKGNESQILIKTSHYYTELFTVPLFLAALLFFLMHTKFRHFIFIAAALFGTGTQASVLDLYRLQQAYAAYDRGEYNVSEESLRHIENRSLESQVALASTFYKQRNYKKALQTFSAIHSTSSEVKQKIYYNMANCYAHLLLFDKAKVYYTRALQLGEDDDSRYNLSLILFKESRKENRPGLSFPASQEGGAGAGKQEGKKQKQEDASGSGSASGGSMQQVKRKAAPKTFDPSQAGKQPMSSKVYELINKGYIHEKKPW